MKVLEKIKDSWKYVKLKDILSIFVFVFALPFALIFKLINKIKHRPLWLICESPDTARDNGYHLYKYIKLNHPECFCYYAIDKKGSDYKKIEQYGNIIQYYSFKHWIYYLAADLNISSQKAGNPNAPLFYFLQVFGFWKNKRVFLQHGITENDLKWLYNENCKFSLFICGAKKEYEFIKDNFGYPEEKVVYTGLARYDGLERGKNNRKQILLMPTWRNWIGREVNALNKSIEFTETLYFKTYFSLINNKKLISYLEKNDIVLYFYPHLNMQKFISHFKSKSPNVKMVLNKDIDIQKLLVESSLMISDFSSVCMDFAYMRKPIIYYQFDKREFREQQYSEGYFSYERDGFGPVFEKEDQVVDKIIEYISNNYKIEDDYLKKINSFFEYNDKENCKRNYEAILKLIY